MSNKEYKDIVSNPIFFERNRVFRVYKGGKLFHDFFGDENVDGNLPEEWVASGVKALNKSSTGEHEGISKVRGQEVYFDWLLKNYREDMLGDRQNFDVLVKMLDSAIRLPAQAHPDKPFSRKYFNSNYGKTEAWLIIATREDAKIYFGFKDGVTREDFVSAIKRSGTEKDIMASLINELPAKTGDVYLIPAKMVHAIGYGCLILEVQEPTDFTVQPEEWCGDYHLSDYEMYLGLDKEAALECFDFSIQGEASIELGRKAPQIFEKTDSYCSETLISYNDTECFAVNRHSVSKGSMLLKNAPAVYIVTGGAGVLENGSFKQEIKKGDYFFLPYAVKGSCSVTAEVEVELIECLPSH